MVFSPPSELQLPLHPHRRRLHPPRQRQPRLLLCRRPESRGRDQGAPGGVWQGGAGEDLQVRWEADPQTGGAEQAEKAISKLVPCLAVSEIPVYTTESRTLDRRSRGEHLLWGSRRLIMVQADQLLARQNRFASPGRRFLNLFLLLLAENGRRYQTNSALSSGLAKEVTTDHISPEPKARSEFLKCEFLSVTSTLACCQGG